MQNFIGETRAARGLWEIANGVHVKGVCVMNPKRSVRPLYRCTRIPKKTHRTLSSDAIVLMCHVSLNEREQGRREMYE